MAFGVGGERLLPAGVGCPAHGIGAVAGQRLAPGALDPLTKELIYVAVSITNNCEDCIHSHTAAARAKGMTEAQFHELVAVAGLANETNRLANGYRIAVDPQFKPNVAPVR